jgi:hypothetical protein
VIESRRTERDHAHADLRERAQHTSVQLIVDKGADDIEAGCERSGGRREPGFEEVQLVRTIAAGVVGGDEEVAIERTSAKYCDAHGGF